MLTVLYIFLYSGQVDEVDKLEEQLDKVINGYNFKVENWHTCFVSEQSILVHNSNCSSLIKQLYSSIKHAPTYPKGFKTVSNWTKKVNINNWGVLEALRKTELGSWKKVYKDGFDSRWRKISIHYFESQSGKVFNVKVKNGWSNR